jgi:aspartate racemase
MKKRIGILGGMSPESTALMYTKITEKYFAKFHDDAFPEIVIFSVDFARMITLQDTGDTQIYAKELMVGINALASAGADFCVIAANSPHMVLDQLSASSQIPILSIVENTAQKAVELGLKKLLLTGTIYTMNSDFYKTAFEKKGIEIMVPNDDDKREINRIISTELDHGGPKRESCNWFKKTIESYVVGAVILGCTELPLLISPSQTELTLLDTLDIHAEKTLEFALK